MEEEQRQIHQQFAVEFFNDAWRLMETENRTRAENDLMLHAAHASLYHWSLIGQPINRVRGEWQISRVYSILHRAEPALYHARRCLEICKAEGIEDFDLAYAYEAVARALAIGNKIAESAFYAEKARQAGEQIQEAEVREQFFEDLRKIPGFQGRNISEEGMDG